MRLFSQLVIALALLINFSHLFTLRTFVPPGIPTSFSVSASPWLQVNLSWIADGTEDFIDVERAPDSSGSPGTFAAVGNTNRSDSNGNINLVHPSGLSPRTYFDDTINANTTYWYRIKARNADGSSGYTSAISVTTANPAGTPVANAGTDFSVKLGEVATFNGESSSGVNTVSWDFGDGETFPYSIARNTLRPAHVYLSAGTKTATLTITNSSGSTSTDTVQVTVTAIAASTGADLVDMGSASNSCPTPANCHISTLSDGSGNWTKFVNAWNYARTRTGSANQTIRIPTDADIFVTSAAVLGAPSGTNYITVEGAQVSGYTRGVRLTSLTSMPEFRITVGGGSVNHATSSNYIRWRGILFTQSAANSFWLHSIGDASTETSEALLSHHFLVEWCAYTLIGTNIAQRGLYILGSDVTVADSYFANIKHTGSDSQALASNIGSRIAIINNLLQGSTENVIVGGFTPPFDAHPRSITLKRNLIEKPLSMWPGNADFSNPSSDGVTYSVKNSVELKAGTDVIIAGNHLLRSWSGGQPFMVLIRAGSDTGNAQTQNVWFAYNKLESMAEAIETTSYENPPRGIRRIVLEHLLIEDLSNGKWYQGPLPDSRPSSRDILHLNGGNDIQFSHITIVKRSTVSPAGHTGLLIMDNNPQPAPWVEEKISKRFVFKDNIALYGSNGVGNFSAGCGGSGQNAIVTNCSMSGGVYTNNLLAQGSSGVDGASNLFVTVANFPNQFVDYNGGNYAIADSSIGNNAATDGTDVGADITNLNIAISHTTVGDWEIASGGGGGGSNNKKRRGNFKGGVKLQE